MLERDWPLLVLAKQPRQVAIVVIVEKSMKKKPLLEKATDAEMMMTTSVPGEIHMATRVMPTPDQVTLARAAVVDVVLDRKTGRETAE
jgi:hypothetical protein